MHSVVEIQRRPRTKTGSGMRRDVEAAVASTQAPSAAKPIKRQPSRKAAVVQQPGTTAVVSRNICFDLKNVFAVRKIKLFVLRLYSYLTA